MKNIVQKIVRYADGSGYVLTTDDFKETKAQIKLPEFRNGIVSPWLNTKMNEAPKMRKGQIR